MIKNNLITVFFFSVFLVVLSTESKAYSIECILDRSKCSLMERIEIKAKKLNPMNYLEKRKECLRRKDNADTVAIGKRVYKNCMGNN